MTDIDAMLATKARLYDTVSKERNYFSEQWEKSEKRAEAAERERDALREALRDRAIIFSPGNKYKEPCHQCQLCGRAAGYGEIIHEPTCLLATRLPANLYDWEDLPDPP